MTRATSVGGRLHCQSVFKMRAGAIASGRVLAYLGAVAVSSPVPSLGGRPATIRHRPEVRHGRSHRSETCNRPNWTDPAPWIEPHASLRGSECPEAFRNGRAQWYNGRRSRPRLVWVHLYEY